MTAKVVAKAVAKGTKMRRVRMKKAVVLCGTSLGGNNIGGVVELKDIFIKREPPDEVDVEEGNGEQLQNIVEEKKSELTRADLEVANEQIADVSQATAEMQKEPAVVEVKVLAEEPETSSVLEKPSMITAFNLATDTSMSSGATQTFEKKRGLSTDAVLNIEPRDASTWWMEASVRWQDITQKFKRKYNFEEAATGMPANQRCRVSVGLRPPATPQRSASSQSSDVAQPNQSPIPNVCPGSMRLNKDSKICAICCSETEPWCAVRFRCQHGYYCSQCIQRHAEARLALGDTTIACPECSVNLAERELRKLLPSELIDRLLVRSLEQAVSSASDIRPCPTPNCPMRVALEEGELGRFRCTMCKRESCLRCGARPYHKGVTCEEHAERARRTQLVKSEEAFREWMQETGTKQCPTCRMAVTKENINSQHTQYKECHKMLCRNCGTRFCFKCCAVLTDTYTCGCSINAHGFIDPNTGKRLEHLRANKRRAR